MLGTRTRLCDSSAMTKTRLFRAFTALALLTGGSLACAVTMRNSIPTAPLSAAPFTTEVMAQFVEPWAMAFLPDSPLALVTEKRGRLLLWSETGPIRPVAGMPAVDYGGQGGLGDVILSPHFAKDGLIYLSWVEAGADDRRGAVVARARLILGDSPRLADLKIIWRQQPKVSGRGHFSHRMLLSPDGRHLFIASGDRQKLDPAQDMTSDLGKILRLLPDGTAAPGNPFAAKGGPARAYWSIGHRNILGMAFDNRGHLWSMEHGPAGGDELNRVRPGGNYGWPHVSEGDHYSGLPIADHATRPAYIAPSLSFTPVIAPGGMIFYDGARFPAWRGQLLIAAMKPGGIVRVSIRDGKVREEARYATEHRIRGIATRQDGSIWLLEDRADGRLLRLTPKQPDQTP